ncbi:MAG: NAD-dependent epimerase/dehydratase family protein [Gaiellales bacterium]
MSRYLVTGCAGFIGSSLASALTERGDDVVGIDSFTEYYGRVLKEDNLRDIDSRRFTLVEADIADLELAELAELAESVDGVFHLAAQPGVRSSWGTCFDRYVRDNVLVTQRIFEAATVAGRRVVWASSSSVYGNAAAYPTPEDAQPQPISPYGVTKLTCEQLARAYRQNAGLDAVALRYFTVYGPRQRPDMAFTRILRALASGAAFSLYGTGEQTRDVTYADDAVAATLLAMEAAPAGRVYNIGGGNETSLSEAIGLLEELAERRLLIEHASAGRGDAQRTAADTTRARTELGWQPATELAEGLRAQLRWAAGTVEPAL